MVSRCLCSIVLSALSVSVQKRETHETARRYNTSHLFTQTQLVDTREMGRRNSDKLIFVAQFPEDRPTSDRGINKPAPSAMEPAKRQISTRHCLQSLGAVFAKRCFNERKG